MEQIFNELISALLQIVVFTFVPFIFFLFRKDKSISFLVYLGFTKPTSKSIVISILTVLFFLAGAIGVMYVDEGVRQMVYAPNSVSGRLRLMGFSAESVTILLIIAILKTSLAEEIFFRGFLAKRLMTALGFNIGNWLQAIIFGLIHLILFWLLVKAGIFPLIFIFTLSTVAALMIGVVKEKYANGSIVPGWVAHGMANVLSYSIIAFLL